MTYPTALVRSAAEELDENSPINGAARSNTTNKTAPAQNGRNLGVGTVVGDDAMFKFRYVDCQAP